MAWGKEASQVARVVAGGAVLLCCAGCQHHTVSVGGGFRQVRGSYGGVKDQFILPIYGLTMGGETGRHSLKYYFELSGFELLPNEKAIPGAEIEGRLWSVGGGVRYYPWERARWFGLSLGAEVFYGEYEFRSYDPFIGMMPLSDGDHFFGLGFRPGLTGEIELGRSGWHLDWNLGYSFTFAESNLAEVDLDGLYAGLTLQVPLGAK